MTPISWARFAPSSITTPSIWWNSGRWVKSIASGRKTRPMMNAFRGGSGCSPSHLRVIGVVCERRIARSASLRSQVYRQPVLPVVPPAVDAPPLAGPEQVRRRLGDFFFQLDPRGEDPLPGRGEGDLTSDRFPLLHQLAPGLQIP